MHLTACAEALLLAALMIAQATPSARTIHTVEMGT